MARKNGNRSIGSAAKGVLNAAWNPFRHLFMATGESAQKLGAGAGKVAKAGVNAVQGVGNSFVKHAGQALKGTRRRRSARRGNSTRRR
jgi:hypothetical protein